MRNLVLFALMLSFAGPLFSQSLPITYQKKFLGTEFRYDNLVVQGTNFRNALMFDDEAMAKLTGSGGLELGAVFLTMTGGILLPYAIFDIQDPDGNSLIRDRATAGAASAIAIVSGIILQSIVTRKRKRAVDVYNKNLGFTEPMGDGVMLRLGPTSEGLGITAKF